jgi:RNA polymerase sigma factor (sigma-70 family)
VRERGATPEQLEELYRARFDRFVRVATGIAGDREAGRDAVQSAFVAAMRNRRTFRGRGALESWLWQIVVNEARRGVAKVATIPLEEAAADHRGSDNGNGDDPSGVRRWVSALPPRQREAVFLRYFADLDYRAIAEILELEPGTVSATLSAAHQTIRKRLEATRR